MPASLQKGLFDGTTYTLEKGLNLRFGRSLDDWYEEVKYAEGSNTYYPLESLVQAAESATSATATAAQASLGLTQAQAQAKLGMPGSSEKQIKQVWSDWSKSFKAANPIFAASLSVRGDIATARRNSIVQSLNDAIDKGTLPEGEWSKQISYMMVAYNQVIAAYPAVKGTHQATVNWDAFLKWGNAYAAKFPVVGPFWNGVLMHQKAG